MVDKVAHENCRPTLKPAAAKAFIPGSFTVGVSSFVLALLLLSACFLGFFSLAAFNHASVQKKN